MGDCPEQIPPVPLLQDLFPGLDPLLGAPDPVHCQRSALDH